MIQSLSTSRRSRKSGFTLIELSIVLVIIGLIVGGVLVGQDLIRAAEIRATVGQVEKYNASLNTFRSKYNALPGDLTSTAANNFGFFLRGGGTGAGDGNGLIEGGAANSVKQCGEPLLLWRDLSAANLIETSISLAAPTGTCTAVTTSNVGIAMPPAKLGRGNYFTVFADSGLNYYQLTQYTSGTTDGTPTVKDGITPLEAFNMDSKMDDGAPNTGIVLARDGTTLNTLGAQTTATCASSTATTGNYNTSGSTASTVLCQQRFRFN